MDNNELNLQNNTNVYQATTNLNTAIENPNVDIDSATNINIQNNLNGMTYNSTPNAVVGNNYNANVVDELIKLIDEFISLEYSLEFEKKMSKCNCEQISNVNNCNKETILKYKEVLNFIKENKIEENTNKIKVYGEAFGELLPNLQF